MALKKAIFIDKDGTLIPDIPFNVNADRITFYPFVGCFLKFFFDQGYHIVVVSNQAGIAQQLFNLDDLHLVNIRLQQLAHLYDFHFSGFYYCPHSEEEQCDCRKPQPGLLLKAAAELKLNLPECWMLGDILNDIEAGKKAGCHTILVDNGGETEWNLTTENTPDLIVHDIHDLFRSLIGGQWHPQ